MYYFLIFRSICKRFNVDRNTALYITRHVINAFIELAPIIIKWINEFIRI